MANSVNELLQELGISETATLFKDRESLNRFLELVKVRYSYGTYYKDLALRELLFDLIPYIDFIPQEVRDLLANPPPEKLPKEQFVEDWESDGLWPSPSAIQIDAAGFLQFIKNREIVTKPFSERNLHNHAYFYSKLMEWYLSSLEIETHQRSHVVDIGSAYFGFGKIAEEIPCVEKIYLVDINYPSGAKPLTEKTVQIGSNANNIELLKNDSVDLVTLHNAIEHFTQGADADCISEIARILKPGGKAIISPLFFEARFAISLNPISAFYFLEDRELASHIIEMREKRNAIVRLSRTMLSSYAHIYDYPSLKATILEHQTNLIPTLRKLDILPFQSEESVHPEVFGIPYQSNAFEKNPFYTLELVKPHS